jgi:AraC-like DNA-binding protein
MHNLLDKHKRERNLTTLVENRTTYNSNCSELNIYETHAFAEKVSLIFDFPIIASMLTGKKIMHLKDTAPFEFLPGESVIMPSNEEMIIDFPLADMQAPTQCLALAIDPEKIKEISGMFNQSVQIENENNDWSIDLMSSHLTNQPEVNHLIKRLVHTFTNNNKSKDMILDLMIKELIVRLLQTNAKDLLLSECDTTFSDTRIGFVINFIQDNLTQQNMTVETLASKANMSSSHFHKQFKNTLGISPIDYVNTERIKFSKKLITEDKKRSITDVAFLSGFNNVSYFNRQFKKQVLVAPSKFRKDIN